MEFYLSQIVRKADWQSCLVNTHIFPTVSGTRGNVKLGQSTKTKDTTTICVFHNILHDIDYERNITA